MSHFCFALTKIKKAIFCGEKVKVLFLLGVILLIGITLRTYAFDDWLRFHKDQARDATLVGDFLEGNRPIPILGPDVGGSSFRMGPIYYYFQSISGFIFGPSPESMAYPDLLFNILSIPLCFFVLKKFFSTPTSFWLTALLSFEFFAIRFSRFAWNPNSQTFFILVFAYALLKIAQPNTENKKVFWVCIVGLMMGVAIQLQAMSLILFPAVGLVSFFFLKVKGYVTWKHLAIALVLVFLCNIPQIVGNYQLKKGNFGEFFELTADKSENRGSIVKSIQCYIHGMYYVFTSEGDDGKCGTILGDLVDIPLNSQIGMGTDFQKGAVLVMRLVIYAMLLFGHLLLARAYIKEREDQKMLFLLIFFAFLSLYFILVIILFRTISMRFFIVMEIPSLVLLGIWMHYFSERGLARIFFFLLFLFLFAVNAFSIYTEYRAFSLSASPTQEGTIKFTLGEAKAIKTFIQQKSERGSKIYIDGNNMDLEDMLSALRYFSEMRDDYILKTYPKKNPPQDGDIYAFDSAKNINNPNLRSGQKEIYLIRDRMVYGRLSMFRLEPVK